MQQILFSQEKLTSDDIFFAFKNTRIKKFRQKKRQCLSALNNASSDPLTKFLSGLMEISNCMRFLGRGDICYFSKNTASQLLINLGCLSLVGRDLLERSLSLICK